VNAAPVTPDGRQVPDALRATGIVAAADLRRRVRNRSALITAFVGPLVFSVVFSVLVGGTSSATFTIGVVALDGGGAATELAQALVDGPPGTEQGTDGRAVGEGEGEAADQVEFVARGDVEQARRQVDEGDLDAAVVVPAGFTSGGAPGAALEVLRSPDRLVAGQVAESVATSLSSRQAQVAAAASLAAGAGTSVEEAVAGALAAQPSTLALVDVAPGGEELSAAAYFGASMSILFLFFTVGFAAR
jgi:ABC-2 type transport system permease protein